MFQPIQHLFTKPSAKMGEYDVRHLIQHYLQHALKTDQVICQGMQKGVAHIRVGNPALYEAVCLLEYDIRCYLKKEAGYELRKTRVVMG